MLEKQRTEWALTLMTLWRNLESGRAILKRNFIQGGISYMNAVIETRNLTK